MKVVKGNLIDMAFNGDFDVIIHGCNCQCRMKSGIAKEIAERIPEAVWADNITVEGDSSKLGTYSYTNKPRTWEGTLEEVIDNSFGVINAYTQEFWGADSRKVDYNAVRKVFRKIAKDVLEHDKAHGVTTRIGYPKIGAGLAGGDWDIISKIIDEELEGFDHTLVEFDG